MTRRILKPGIQLALAVLAAIGAVASWWQVRTVVDVAPVAAGQPGTTSITYYPPMMLLTLVLATAAGVFAVLGAAGLCRLRSGVRTRLDG
ncbi:MAG: hypothetical protein U0R81_03260 [Mycobacterium sp.]